MITETSRKAYQDLLDTGKIGPMQEMVYEAFYNFPKSSDREVHEKTGLEISMINGRRNELMELGLIRECGQKLGEKNAMVNIYECGVPDKKDYTGLSNGKFESTIKNIRNANNYQKQKFKEVLGCSCDILRKSREGVQKELY